jgi:hypothetical protein
VAPSSPVQPSLSPISKQSRRGVRSRCTRSKPRNCTSKGSNGRARERSFELKIGWDSSIVFLRVVWCARLPSIQSVKARICQTKLITSKHACRRTQIFTLFFFLHGTSSISRASVLHTSRRWRRFSQSDRCIMMLDAEHKNG